MSNPLKTSTSLGDAVGSIVGRVGLAVVGLTVGVAVGAFDGGDETGELVAVGLVGLVVSSPIEIVGVLVVPAAPVGDLVTPVGDLVVPVGDLVTAVGDLVVAVGDFVTFVGDLVTPLTVGAEDKVGDLVSFFVGALVGNLVGLGVVVGEVGESVTIISHKSGRMLLVISVIFQFSGTKMLLSKGWETIGTGGAPARTHEFSLPRL